MAKILCIFSMVLALVSYSNSDYVAAVVEYQAISSTTANNTIQTNLKEYIRYMEEAKKSFAQIIVFPEYGLTGLVEDPNEYAIEVPAAGAGPIFSNHLLQELSNGAIGHGMYVIVNLLEKAQNKKNQRIFYNTNVVFDRDGQLKAKYRKINLFNEPKVTPGSKSKENHVTFNTEFGITFGLFTCYDMFFYDPSRTILANTSVTDVIFPSAWYSSIPFYHSLSFHAAYAQANKVNLLVSNHNNVREGMGGSGIYGADGTIYSSFISGTSKAKLLIATVRTAQFDYQGFDILDNDDNQIPLTGYNATRDFNSNIYKFLNLNLSQENISERICDGDFCCTFDINVSFINSSDVYKLMAYSGPKKICSLVACETNEPSTCGAREVNITSKFKSISVETDVAEAAKWFYQPLSLTRNLLPIFNTTYDSSVVTGRRSIAFKTSKVGQDVVAFGIYGSNATNLGFSLILLVVSIMAKYLF